MFLEACGSIQRSPWPGLGVRDDKYQSRAGNGERRPAPHLGQAPARGCEGGVWAPLPAPTSLLGYSKVGVSLPSKCASVSEPYPVSHSLVSIKRAGGSL